MDYQVMEEEYALDSGMVLIVSDSHSRNENLEKVMERVSPDLMLHLGDSEDYEDWIREAAPCPVVFVKGNCDYGRELPGAAIVRLGRHRAYLTHGHMHGVSIWQPAPGRTAVTPRCTDTPMCR